MNELVASNFNGIDEIVHADGILAGFIQEHIEIELVVIVVMTVGVIAKLAVFDCFQQLELLFRHLALLFGHLLGLLQHNFFEILILFEQFNNKL